MTLDELRQHRLYLHQTEQRRTWIDAAINNGGDFAAATKEVYPTAKNPSVMGRQIAADPEITEIFNIYYGETDEPSIEEYRHLLLKWINEAKSDAAKAAYSQQYIELRGWKKSIPKSKDDSDKILEGLV